MGINLEKKKTAKYPKHLSLRVAEDLKSMYDEMSSEKYEVAEPARIAVEQVIRNLYNSYLKLKKSS